MSGISEYRWPTKREDAEEAAVWVDKVWGLTRLMTISANSETHKLVLGRYGSFCSKHMHSHKSNVFHVTHGFVRVITEGPKGMWLTHDLFAGCSLYVPPATYHQFQVLETGSEMIEVYFTEDDTEVDPDDIVRQWEGGFVENFDLNADPVWLRKKVAA